MRFKKVDEVIAILLHHKIDASNRQNQFDALLRLCMICHGNILIPELLKLLSF